MSNGSPNVLLITCDQLRADVLGCYGDEYVKTPNIDRLAETGVCFDRMFAAKPVCAPNRAAMATGRYPSVNGLRSNGICLPESEQTLMEVLRQRGYGTYGTGKMHFEPQWRTPEGGGPLVDPEPDMAHDPQPDAWEMPWYGFEDVRISEDNRVGPYGKYLEEHGYDVWDDPHSFSYPQHQCVQSVYPEEHYQTTWIADRAIDYLEQHPDRQPFFLWTSFVDPHHPFTPPAPFDTMYDPEEMPDPVWREGESELWPEEYRRKHTATSGGHEAIGMCNIEDSEWRQVRAYYYGMISLIDKQVGRLLDALEARGDLEDTVIVFTSDHGEMLGDHHLVFKGTLFDEVTRTPFIVRGPGIEATGQRRSALASAIDLMPTVLDLCEATVPDAVQGQSLVPVIQNSATDLRDGVLIEQAGATCALRTKDYLLCWHGPQSHNELYDLEEDPHCSRNLWGEDSHASIQSRLLGQLMEKVIQNVDPVPVKAAPC